MKNKLGISGGLARRFQNNALTPLLAVTALLMGLCAGTITPREEEPQIDVTLANVFVAFPGASTTEVENLIAIPMEQVLSEIAQQLNRLNGTRAADAQSGGYLDAARDYFVAQDLLSAAWETAPGDDLQARVASRSVAELLPRLGLPIQPTAAAH